MSKKYVDLAKLDALVASIPSQSTRHSVSRLLEGLEAMSLDELIQHANPVCPQCGKHFDEDRYEAERKAMKESVAKWKKEEAWRRRNGL